MKIKNLLIWMMCIIVLSQIVFANVILEKTVSDTVQPNEWFSIDVRITNDNSYQITGTLYESQLSFLEYRDYEPFVQTGWYKPPYISVDKTVDANSYTDVSFVVKTDAIGNFLTPNSTFNVNSKTYFSNSVEFSVLCNQNNVCEKDLGEDYETCSHDCSTGSSDGECDMIKDGKVDPDCLPGYDPDFVTDSCSNGVLDEGELDVDCGSVCDSRCFSLISDILEDVDDFKIVIGSEAAAEDNIAAIDLAGKFKIETVEDFEVDLNQNLIVLGGPCVNTVAFDLMDSAYCTEEFADGEGSVKLFKNGEYYQLLVAGYNALDTRIAARSVVMHEEFEEEFNVNSLVTHGSSLDDVNVVI